MIPESLYSGGAHDTGATEERKMIRAVARANLTNAFADLVHSIANPLVLIHLVWAVAAVNIAWIVAAHVWR